MNRCLTLFSLLLLLTAPLSAADADDLVGVWKTEPKENGFAHVEISRNGDTYDGTIIYLSEPEFPASEGPEWAGKTKVDRNNPDASKRGQPIIGLPLAWGFTYQGDGRWEGGRIYDPENGKTYKCKIGLADDGTLDVRGYVGFSLLGRTTKWTPVATTGSE